MSQLGVRVLGRAGEPEVRPGIFGGGRAFRGCDPPEFEICPGELSSKWQCYFFFYLFIFFFTALKSGGLYF